jgi:hypothetical protein
VWRVGNGKKISVWKDKWIPNFGNGKAQSQVSVLLPEAKVSELIDPSSNQWNTHLLYSLFSPREVDSICSIPLSPLGLQIDWYGL